MTVTRRMRDPGYRAAQLAGVREPHVAPFADLVDELAQGRGDVPYVAPIYGGTHARVLSLLASPGPASGGPRGSGLLSVQNDGPAAERMALLLDGAGIPVAELLTWNAYPWHLPDGESALTAARLEAGVEPLRRALALAPRITVAVLHGRKAQDSWRRLSRRHPDVAAPIRAIGTWSTADRTFMGLAARSTSPTCATPSPRWRRCCARGTQRGSAPS